MRVYVAGKLNDDAVNYIKHVHNMIYYADQVKQKGHAVFVPCLDLLMGLQCGFYHYTDYFNNNQEFLKVCDAIFVCPGYETSAGTKKEIELAKTLGIHVYYNLEEL